MPKMNVNEFIKKVIGVKWVDRASTFKQMDCWGLVILYYRHVLKIELATIIGYETSQATLQNDALCEAQRHWLPCGKINNAVFLAYVGDVPSHVGIVIDNHALHANGNPTQGGQVQYNRLDTLERAYTWSTLNMLIYHKDPKGLTEKEIYPLDTHLSLLQNIRNRFPHGFNHQLTDIYINSEKIDPLTYDLSKKATIFDQIVIVNRQQQQLIIAVVAAIIAAVISYALTPTPKTPNSSGEQRDSSNNKLTGN